ncbi:hypothetical protein H4I96_11182 [Botrytis cinerea]
MGIYKLIRSLLDLIPSLNTSYSKDLKVQPKNDAMVLPSNLTTREHSSFSRHVGTLEDLFNNISEVKGSINREHTSFFVVLQLHFPPTKANVEEFIARAWESLGQRYPALRAQISPRASSTLASSRAFLCNPGMQQSSARRSPRTPTAQTSTFLSALADELQQCSSAPLGNNGSKQLLAVPESLESLVRKYLPAPLPEEKAEIDEMVETFAKGRQSIGFPPDLMQARQRLAFDSAKLISGCQTQGISVTSAVNAAVIRTAAQFPQDPGADAYAIFAPVNFRMLLMAAGAQECSQPTGNYVSGASLRIDNAVGKSFRELANELNTIYSQDFTRYERPGGGKTLNLLQSTESYIQFIAKLFALFPSPGCPFPKAPVISSFGKMDMIVKSEYGGDSDDTTGASKLRVTDFWVSCDCATPMITFNPYSWGGAFTLSSAWEDSYYEREFVIDALEKTMAELVEGLEIDPLSYRITTGCNDASTRK